LLLIARRSSWSDAEAHPISLVPFDGAQNSRSFTPVEHLHVGRLIVASVYRFASDAGTPARMMEKGVPIVLTGDAPPFEVRQERASGLWQKI
jgi:hypothetical protein